MGFWTEYKTHPNQQDWLLALVRRHECFHEQAKELDKWCQTDLFMTQVLPQADMADAHSRPIPSITCLEGSRLQWCQ